MPNLFGLNIAKIVGDAFNGKLVTGSMTHFTLGAQNADSTAGKQRTPSTHAVQGILEDYTDDKIDGTNARRADRKILLMANLINPFVVPEMNDVISMEGTAYTIVADVKRDPAAATFECLCRST